MRVLVLVLLVGCSDDAPSSSMTVIGGACDGLLAVERDTSGPHVPMGTVIEWTTNPPTSGPHYPIWAAWDREYTALDRGHYVHNLEHGGIVLAYRCDSGCPDTVEALRVIARGMTSDTSCTAPVTKRVIITGDPLLPTDLQIAALAWNHAYTASCVDDYVATFARDHYARAPEDLCYDGANLGGTSITP